MNRLRIGFVGVVRPLFKGDTPRLLRDSLAALGALGRDYHFELVTPSVANPERHVATGQALPPFAVSDLDTAEQSARQLREAGLDFLLVQQTTFATGELMAPLLGAARRVGVWALAEPAQKDGPLPLNALCGLNMTLSLLKHPAVGKTEPVKWFYGEATSAWFKARLVPTLQALRGLRAMEGARILQIGGTAPGFYGLEEVPALAGVTVDAVPLGVLFERVAAVAEGAAWARAQDWLREATAGRAQAVSEAVLVRAARIELALTELARKGGYHALALRCWPELPEVCEAMACAAVGRLADGDLPTTCEGDVMGALSMLALQGVSGQPAMLLDLSDWDDHDDQLLFWHCGNAPLAWAGEPGVRLTAHFNRELGVVRDMTIRPGPASGFRLLARGARALVFSGVFAEPVRPGFDGVRGWLGRLRWLGTPVDAKGFLANVLDYRLPHHFAFGMGELTDGLVELCAWLGAKPLPLLPWQHTLRNEADDGDLRRR